MFQKYDVAFRAALMGSVAVVAVLAQPAAAQDKAFNIPAQDAVSAVPSFVQQSGLQILATANDLKGIKTNAVEGNMSADAALAALISNTGLTVKSRDNASAVLGRVATAESKATDAAATAPADNQEVVVVGMRKSMRDALATKRAEPGVVEVVSSKDIGVLPDVTIAETLDRLPGLNVTRDRGNDSQAAIRGLGPRMVLGLINGRELASSEPDRNVRWEIFPSEVVSGVEVYKSSEAKLVSGGISGTVDIQTIRPLDYKGPSLTLRAGPVYYDGGTSLPNYDGMGYRASGAYVAKLTPTLGWVVAASVQRQKNGYENIMGGGWNTAPGNLPGPVSPAAGAPNVETPWGASFEEKAITTDRASLSSSLQWKPTDHFEGRFDVLESDIKIDEQDNGGWYSDWGNWGGYETGTTAFPGFTNNVIENGALVKTDMTFWSTYHPYVAHYQQDMKLFATGANGKWRYDDWTIVADVAYSQAQRYGIWQAAEMQNNAGPASYDYRGAHPSIKVQISAWDAAKAGGLSVNNGDADVSNTKDQLTTANLDFDRHLNGDFWTSLKFGARVSSRSKFDLTFQGGFASGYRTATPIITTVNATLAQQLFTPWNYKNFSVPTFISGDFATVATALYGAAGYATINPDFKHLPFGSEVDEDVTEAYLEGNYASTFAGVPVDGNVGVRVVNVDSSSTGPQTVTNTTVTPNTTTTTVVTLGQKYTKVLPSFLARFTLGDGAYLKVGVSQAMSRPPLNDLRVDRSYSITTPPYSGGGGNPYLKPYLADQLDVSYENYFRKDGLFAVAAYTKNISNFIGINTVTETLPGITQPINFSSPHNRDKNGTLSGVEFTYQTPFYFIPGFEKFGIYSNAAFTASNIHENNPVSNPYPMNGVAKTTATLDLWYADDKFESRLGFKYHTPFTILYGWDSGALTAIRSELTADFSASYKISENLQVRFQAGNLLNTPLRTYTNNNPAEIERTDYYGHRFLLDLTYKY